MADQGRTVRCKCGAQLPFSKEMAGKQIRCAKCKSVVAVPSPTAVTPAVKVEVLPSSPSRKTVNCLCGQRLIVDTRSPSFRCPKCKTTLQIAGANPAIEFQPATQQVFSSTFPAASYTPPPSTNGISSRAPQQLFPRQKRKRVAVRKEHRLTLLMIQLASCINGIFGFFALVGGMALFAGFFSDDPNMDDLLRWTLLLVGPTIAALGATCVAGAVGVLTRRRWAVHMYKLSCCFLFFLFPAGTIIVVYSVNRVDELEPYFA